MSSKGIAVVLCVGSGEVIEGEREGGGGWEVVRESGRGNDVWREGGIEG